MANTDELIRRTYAAFNARDIDAVLAMMSEDVDWPKASEGGRVIGKDGIRAYWTRQWAEVDPRVEPLAVVAQSDGSHEVQVHQVVKKLDGTVISDIVLAHVYRFKDGLIARMDIVGGQSAFGRE